MDKKGVNQELKHMAHTFVGTVNWFRVAATLFDDAPTFSCFTFLFFLQFFSSFLTEQQLFGYIEIEVCIEKSIGNRFENQYRIQFNSHEVSSFFLGSWNLSLLFWPLKLLPYAYALQHVCAQFRPVWPSLPIWYNKLGNKIENRLKKIESSNNRDSFVLCSKNYVWFWFE